MKRSLMFVILLLALSFSVVAQHPDADAAKVPLDNYLKGHATGDGEFFKKAFHTEGNMIFVRDGKYTTRSFAEYIAGRRPVSPPLTIRKPKMDRIRTMSSARRDGGHDT